MRKLIVIAAALLLAACATPPQQPTPIVAAASSGIVVAGTLSLGPCELSVAPYITRVSVAAQKATRRVQDGRMSKSQGMAVADRGAALLAALNAVCPLQAQGQSAAAQRNREWLSRDLPEFEAMITEVPR